MDVASVWFRHVDHTTWKVFGSCGRLRPYLNGKPISNAEFYFFFFIFFFSYSLIHEPLSNALNFVFNLGFQLSPSIFAHPWIPSTRPHRARLLTFFPVATLSYCREHRIRFLRRRGACVLLRLELVLCRTVPFRGR